MPRINKKLKGGNATSMPSEYFGGVSGRYSDNAFSNPGSFADGEYMPHSFGVANADNTTGPNMGVYPNNTTALTGGRRKRSKKTKRSKRSKSVRKSKRAKRGKRSKRR
jgi:hypothetical protein